MGKSSGGSPQVMMIPQQQSSTQTVSLPGWVDQAAQENLRMANDVSGRMPGPYSGQRVADMTPGQLNAINAINQNVGSTAGQFNAASNLAATAFGSVAPSFQSAMSLAGSSINPQSVNQALAGLGQIANQGVGSANYTPGQYNQIQYGTPGFDAISADRQNYSPIDYYANPATAGMNAIYGQLNPETGLMRNANQAIDRTISTDARAQNIGNVSAQDVTAQSLPQGDIAAYMNPYTENVINTSLSALDKQRQGALNNNADAALRSSAFGGSRAAIQDAVTNSQFASRGAELAANLQNQNFQQAQAALQADQQRNLQAQLANQQAGLQASQANQGKDLNVANLGLSAANQIGDLGLNAARSLVDAGQTFGALGLQNKSQDIGAQQANINAALQARGQNLDASQANLQAQLQRRGQDITAQQANMQAALSDQSQASDVALQNIANQLQGRGLSLNALNSLGNMGLSNAQLTQSAAGLMGNLGNQFAGLGLDTSRTLGDLSGAGQQALLQGANAGIDASGLLQNQQQNQITAAQQAIADQRAAMLDPIMLRLQALGQTPYGQTTTGSSMGLQGQMYQPTSSNPLLGLLGAGMTGLNAASRLGWQPLGR